MLVMRFRRPVGTFSWGREFLALWTDLGAGSEVCLTEPRTKSCEENDDSLTGFRDCMYLASLLGGCASLRCCAGR